MKYVIRRLHFTLVIKSVFTTLPRDQESCQGWVGEIISSVCPGGMGEICEIKFTFTELLCIQTKTNTKKGFKF